MKKRGYNFSAGPACLPEAVLKSAKAEFMSYGDSGMNVMEMSHRGKVFSAIAKKAEQDLRDLMDIPDDYRVLFLQGGASTQFYMIPLNLMTKHKNAHFISTGIWAKKAIAEAKKFASANVVASSDDQSYSYIPETSASDFTADADYVHIVPNNTIFGTKFQYLPETNGLPLVADMSSCILSEKINVSDYGIIFAGAQKNIGPAGLTIVIIKNKLIDDAPKDIPTMMSYKTHRDAGSMFNTPPTYSIYMAGKVFEWLKKNGGIEAMNKTNIEKATMLYDYIDGSKLYSGNANKADRSLMNVTFATGDADLDAKFVEQSEKAGLMFLKGHRLSGGMRASIYNAMPKAGVEALVDFMRKFENTNLK